MTVTCNNCGYKHWFVAPWNKDKAKCHGCRDIDVAFNKSRLFERGELFRLPIRRPTVKEPSFTVTED